MIEKRQSLEMRHSPRKYQIFCHIHQFKESGTEPVPETKSGLKYPSPALQRPVVHLEIGKDQTATSTDHETETSHTLSLILAVKSLGQGHPTPYKSMLCSRLSIHV